MPLAARRRWGTSPEVSVAREREPRWFAPANGRVISATPLLRAHCSVRHCLPQGRRPYKQLCRHVTRQGLANERVQCSAAGQVTLKLKTPWRDETMHLEMSLGKGGGLVCAGDRQDSWKGFRLVTANQAQFPVATMCRVLRLSSAGYYAWCKRPPCAHALRDEVLLKRIRAYFGST